ITPAPFCSTIEASAKIYGNGLIRTPTSSGTTARSCPLSAKQLRARWLTNLTGSSLKSSSLRRLGRPPRPAGQCWPAPGDLVIGLGKQLLGDVGEGRHSGDLENSHGDRAHSVSPFHDISSNKSSRVG